MDLRAAYYIPFVIIQSIITDFIAQLVSVLDIGSSFGLPPVTLWQAPILFWALLYIRVPQDAPVSSYVFFAPPLESTTSTRTSVGKWHLATNIWALGMFIITGISLILDSISGHAFTNAMLSWFMWLNIESWNCVVKVPTLFVFKIALVIWIALPLSGSFRISLLLSTKQPAGIVIGFACISWSELTC